MAGKGGRHSLWYTPMKGLAVFLYVLTSRQKGALFMCAAGTPPGNRRNPSQTPLYVYLPYYGGQPPDMCWQC